MSDYHSDKNGLVSMKQIDEWWEYRMRYLKGQVTKAENEKKLPKLKHDNSTRDAKLVRDTAQILKDKFMDTFHHA